MANLLKERARRPIVENGGCYASERYNNGKPMFRITLFDNSSTHYEVELTRTEMLGIASKWLEIETNHAVSKDKAERKEAEVRAAND